MMSGNDVLDSFTFDSISGNIPDNLIPHDVSFDPLISIEDKTPSVLCGQLVSSGNCGLVIQDKTCSVQCMLQDLDISDVGSFILVNGYSYIRNPIHSYIEVTEYQCITRQRNVPTSRPSCCTDKSLQNRKTLTGIVVAVSTPLSLGGTFYVCVDLYTSEGKSNVIIKATHLLYLYCHMSIGDCYVFTEMKESVLNKGKYNQLRVMVTTEQSAITKATVDDSAIIPPSMHGPTLVSYQGTITKVILPEIGVYELDDTIRLYLCCLSNINNGQGFRLGNEILISNAHFIQFPSQKWKHLSGFVCCTYSSIRFTKLSKIGSSNEYKPFLSQGNRLKKFIIKYSISDIALLLEVYRYCKHELRIRNLDGLLSILSTVATSTGLTSSKHTVAADPVSLFFSSPHHCPLFDGVSESLLYDESYSVMILPTMTDLTHTIAASDVIPSNSDRDSLVQFTYAQSVINQMLVIGRLNSNQMGGVTLDNYTGQSKVTVLLSSDILPHVGDYLVLSSARVIQERTYIPSSNTSSTVHYIVPLQWTPVSINTAPPQPLCIYFIVITKNRPTVMCALTETLVADIHLRTSTDPNTLLLPASDHNSETILRLTDITHYYSILRPGCLYSLVSPLKTPLPSLSSLLVLSDDYVIEFLEEHKKWEVVSTMGVQQLLTTYTKSAIDNRSEVVVSVSGTITDHSYRLPEPPSMCLTSLDRFTVAIYLKSTKSPDTIVVYIHGPEHYPPPIGLIPGAEVKFVQVTLKSSQSHNLYCTYSGISSVQILRFPVSLNRDVVPVKCDLPITHLSHLIQQHTAQELSSASVCLLGRIMSVLYVEMRVTCPVHSAEGGGRNISCSKYCNKEHSVIVEGSALFCDGSGQCTLYFDTNCSQSLLKCNDAEWSRLMQATHERGILKYYKIQERTQNEGEALLQSVVRSSDVTRELRLLCKPFSSSYSYSSNDRGSPRTKKLKVCNEVYTVEIPNQRLQLSIVSILKINYAEIAQEFHCSMESS